MSHWPHHPDDEPSPRFGNHWSNDFNTYEDACAFYGCDSPAAIRREMEIEQQEEWVAWQDRIEARGPQFYILNEEIPF